MGSALIHLNGEALDKIGTYVPNIYTMYKMYDDKLKPTSPLSVLPVGMFYSTLSIYAPYDVPVCQPLTHK